MNEDDQQKITSSFFAATPGAFNFFGCYSHSIDAKGRIIIPNAYRDMLGETFTIGPARDFKGIALYPEPVYESILRELSALNQRKRVVQTYTQQFYKLSYRGVQADTQGRLLLPPKLRQRMLGEARDLEISGGFNHVRIVEAEKADRTDEAFMDTLDQTLDQIGEQELD
ncbi:MAG: hypothetical protein VB104_09355 [Candidatus Limiplasma sp.]|nr:hypothetical protein [Candidatus Limiplasma sp.]